MALVRESREHDRLSSAYCPDIKAVSIEVTREVTLTLDVPSFRVTEGSCEAAEFSSSLPEIVSAHATFKAAMQSDTGSGDPFYEACIAEVRAISLCFPDIKSDFLRIAFTAWLAFACIMDDILEVMPLKDRESTLLECIQIIKDTLDYLPSHLVPITAQCRDGRIQNITRLLYNHCVQYLPQASARAFFEAVCVVLEAHIDEVRFLQGRVPNNFSTYITIRSRTIALNPFFEVIKTEFLAETEWQFNSAWEKLQLEVSRVAGLQNDLIGLARDLEDGEQLNAITVLMRSYGGIDKAELNSALLSWCIAEVSAEHNQGITRCLYYASQLHLTAKELGLQGAAMDTTEFVVRHILLLCETHLKWCASSKRYSVKSCISQRHSIHPDSPFLPTVCDSYTRVAMVKGTPYADGSEGNIGTTSDSRTESQLESSV